MNIYDKFYSHILDQATLDANDEPDAQPRLKTPFCMIGVSGGGMKRLINQIVEHAEDHLNSDILSLTRDELKHLSDEVGGMPQLDKVSPELQAMVAQVRKDIWQGHLFTAFAILNSILSMSGEDNYRELATESGLTHRDGPMAELHNLLYTLVAEPALPTVEE